MKEIDKQIELLKDFASGELYGISREILSAIIQQLEESNHRIDCEKRALQIKLLMLENKIKMENSIDKINKMLRGKA